MSMQEENKILVQTHVQRLNEGDVSGYMQMYDPGCVFHGYPPDVPPDPAGVGQFYAAMTDALPDAKVTAEDIVAEGDRVAVRYTLTGTHRGELMGAPATGNAVSAGGITVLRVSGGRVVERWNRLDDVALLTAIGALPPAEVRPA